MLLQMYKVQNNSMNFILHKLKQQIYTSYSLVIFIRVVPAPPDSSRK